jgi:beta-glucanase (GH16 family)
MQYSKLTYKLFFNLVLFVLIVFTFSCKKTEKAIPTLSFEASVSLEEGTASQQFVTILVKLSNDYDDLVKMYYQTTDGTAVEGEDYVGYPETELIFNVGETSKEIKIAIVNDDIFEDNESFLLVVNKVTNGKLAQSMCNITIVNDDSFVPEVILPDRVRISEGTNSTMIPLTIRLSGATTVPVTIKWSTVEGSAKAGSDFTQSIDNTLTFNAGVIAQQIQVEVLGDNMMELDEGFFIHFSDVQNATFVPKDIVIIMDNDDNFSLESLDDGPISPDSYDGFELAWSDEFDGSSINTNNWGYDIGAGGWGNSELQSYTSSPVNSFVEDGKLSIVATKLYATYNSARLLSKNKKDFTYGRIDIRAKMPVGKGIWPALWMLGANISQVSWPRCGEIDIMEYLGHIPKQVHGTVHYNDGGHRYIGGQYTLSGSEGFNAKFHVFTILWSEYGIRWYVDYQPFYSIDDTDVKFEAFRLPQFFIMNVAVGGVWPGYPDETTVFPQTMQVDYVRVFQQPE